MIAIYWKTLLRFEVRGPKPLDGLKICLIHMSNSQISNKMQTITKLLIRRNHHLRCRKWLRNDTRLVCSKYSIYCHIILYKFTVFKINLCSRSVRNVSRSTFNFDPVSEMHRAPMKHIQILDGHVVNCEKDERSNPNQSNVLTNPPRIVIKSILENIWWKPLLIHIWLHKISIRFLNISSDSTNLSHQWPQYIKYKNIKTKHTNLTYMVEIKQNNNVKSKLFWKI